MGGRGELTEIDVGSCYREGQINVNVVGLILSEARNIRERDQRVRRRRRSSTERETKRETRGSAVIVPLSSSSFFPVIEDVPVVQLHVPFPP